VAGDGLPLSVLDSPRFRRLIAVLDRRFSPPGSKAVKSHLSGVFTDLVTNSRQEMVREHFSVNVDTWTSGATESYVGVTAQYITRDWNMATTSLGLRAIPNLSAASIAEGVEAALDGLRPFAVTTDNGANVCAAVDLLAQERHVRCVAHTLQLVLEPALENEGVSALLQHARAVVSHIRHSPTVSTHLASTCRANGLSKTKLIGDVPTRWDSSYYMLQRLHDLGGPVAQVLLQPRSAAPTRPHATMQCVGSTLQE
jgi:hypothetical protein